MTTSREISEPVGSEGQKRFGSMLGWLSEAEEIARSYFRSVGLSTENKETDGYDPVTIADREIEASFRAFTANEFPYDAVLGEELDNRSGTSGFQWTIDPIDGTRAFVIGAPSFCILVALERNGVSIGSVVSQPFTGERFIALDGEARYARGVDAKKLADEQGTRISVRPDRKLENSVLCTTFPEIGNEGQRLAFERVANRVPLVRYGLDAYAYALLALGHVDLVIEAGLKPFDYRAPTALIRAAGGFVSDWQGQEPTGVSTLLAASNEGLARTVIEILNEDK